MNLLLISCLLALSAALTWAESDYCFATDTFRDQIHHFTSKTPYQIAKSSNIEQQSVLPGCVAKKIWILHRHGTRLPSKSTIKNAPKLEKMRDSILNNYRVLNTAPQTNAMCDLDLDALQAWKWNASITPDMENYLTSQGYADLRGTAQTYQKYFPEVLTKKYNGSYYLFRHTDTQRTTESFKAFTEGLFGADSGAVAQNIPQKDVLLRPYDYCQSWSAQNFKGPGSETAKYRNSAIWNQTLADVSTRLGFQNTLDSADVELMYDICRYEQAWHVDQPSVWCAAFTADHVSVFEYEDDMKYYYKSGYGFAANSRLNCRAVQDMYARLDSDKMPNVVTYFGHSTGVQTLINALGIDKDDIAMLANNSQSLNDRKWKTSTIDPFASNFLAVKYQCDNETVEKEKVIFFLNQNAVNLTWCPEGVCNWSEVKERYSTVLNADCDSYYCADGATTMNLSLISLLVAGFVYLMNLM